MKPVKIVISLADLNFAQTNSMGMYNVATNLARGLARVPAVALTVLNSHAAQAHIEGAKNLYFDAAAGGKLRRMLWDQFGVYAQARQHQPDWLLLPKGYLSFAAKPPCRTIAYVHDVIYHEFHHQRIPGFSPFNSLYFRKCIEAALRRAHVLVTNSQYSKEEVLALARRLGYREPAITPVGIGFDPPRPAAAKLDQILVLVSRWPNKVTPLAVEYLERWERQSGFKGQILCVGSLPAGVTLPARWQFLQRLPQDRYEHLMASSKALVYFTRSEGFGMPPIEAALRGTAPVYSAIPATDEVMAGMGCPFQNEDFESFRAAMAQALRADAATVAQWARALHARHNWDRVVERLLAALG